MPVIRLSWKDSGKTIVKAIVGKVNIVSGSTGSGLQILENSMNPSRIISADKYVDCEMQDSLRIRPVMLEAMPISSDYGTGNPVVESIRSYIYAHGFSESEFNAMWGPLSSTSNDVGLYVITNLAKIAASGVDRNDVLTMSFPESYMDTESQAFFVTTVMAIQRIYGCTVILFTRSPDCIQASYAVGMSSKYRPFFWYGYPNLDYKFFGNKISYMFKEFNKSLDLIDTIMDGVEDEDNE